MGRINDVLNRMDENSKNPSKEEVIEFLKGFKKVLPKSNSGDWGDRVHNDDKWYSIDVRHWGNWYVSDDSKNDSDNEDEDFEDYDWEVLSDKDYKIAKDAFEDYLKTCPFKNQIKNHSIDTEEKNWLAFSINLK